MKIEKRDNSVFVSHNGLTILANKTREGYSLKTTEMVESSCARWVTAELMELTTEDFRKWLSLLAQLRLG